MKQVKDLPRQQLFQYLDEGGQPHPVSSTDVNAYIREAVGEDFTAKHFRTWAASVLAFEYLAEHEDCALALLEGMETGG